MGALSLPKVAKKPWMESVQLLLATVDDLDRIAQECIAAKNYGLDIETTGLDARVFPSEDGTPVTNDRIVGICIAPRVDLSYYLPIRHKEEGADTNIPPRLVMEMIKKIQAGGAVAAFHNGKFDQEFLEHDPAGQMGDWADPDCWEDTLILAYLENSREKRKGLKHLAKLYLEREMIELEELFPDDVRKTKKFDFSTLDPKWDPVVWYAAADAMNTLALRDIFFPKVVDKNEFGHSQKTVYKMEKMCATGTRWMERCRVPIDRDVVMNLIRLGQKEWFDCLKEVYLEAEKAVGRDPRPDWFREMTKTFDPNCLEPNYKEAKDAANKGSSPGFMNEESKVQKSVPSLADPKIRETVTFPSRYDVTNPPELGLLMREVGVRGLKATEKSGQIATGKEELDRVVEESGEEFPFMMKVKRFREVAKALSTNLFPIYYDSAPDRSPDGRLWVAFNAWKTDTGRFSTPASDNSEFRGQARWNVHSTPADRDKDKPECARKIRTCVRAKPGRVLFAIDYSGVELRIVTNLSGEPKWVDEFFRCSSCDNRFDRHGEQPPYFCPNCGSDKIGDLHTLTAQAVYGDGCLQEPDFKVKRGYAKALNFAMCYGGGGSAAQRSVGVEQEEGWRIKRQFDKSYKGLTKWWEKQHNDARRQQYVLTAYGRKYPVPDIVNPNQMFRSKAERNSVNGPVQGTSADIMKLAMGLLYREFRKRGWLTKALVCITIHDELVWEIDEDIAEEAVEVIVDIMLKKTIGMLGWVVKLGADVEFGDDWTVKYDLNKMVRDPKAWSERWKRVFPKHYAACLEFARSKGEEIPPSEGDPPPPSTPSKSVLKEDPSTETEFVEPIRETPKQVREPMIEKSGGEYIFRISRFRLTPDIASLLSKVLLKCVGRGSDTLKILSEDGEDLMGESFKVSYQEFKIIAGYEGL